MKATVLALSLSCLLPAGLTAQRYDYQLLLDSGRAAAGSALLRTGHSAEAAMTRPDGYTQSPFTTVLPDANGAPARGELRVTIVSRGDSVVRVFARAEAQGRDTVLLLAAGRYFAARLGASFGQPASVEQDVDWCWTTPRNFIDVTLDRQGGGMTLTLGFDRHLR